jgi:hypothetical protein
MARHQVGDLLCVRASARTSPWPGEDGEVIQEGALYRVVGRVEHGLDLSLEKGSGPVEVRVLESQVDQFFASYPFGLPRG